MDQRIWSFSTPTRGRAPRHPKDHFGWMLRGEELHQVLGTTHPLCSNLSSTSQNCCIETFPRAIPWHLAGGSVDASKTRTQRRRLLEKARIAHPDLTIIDLIDAALCALAAYRLAIGNACVGYGEPSTGLIIVPDGL